MTYSGFCDCEKSNTAALLRLQEYKSIRATGEANDESRMTNDE
jgi:hypothetical protein